MPRLAARWSGRSARCDRPGTGREVLVLKGYDEVAVFLGLDVGKQGHHAVAQDRSGKKLLDRALPNDEAKLRELYGRMKVHGPVLLVVDQPATIGALPVAVALDEGITVAYLPGLAMRRIADLHPGSAKTDARDAAVIADAARTMPHTLRAAETGRRKERRAHRAVRVRRRPRAADHRHIQPDPRAAHPDPPGPRTCPGPADGPPRRAGSTRNMAHPSRSHQGWEEQGAQPATQTRTPHRCTAHRGDLCSARRPDRRRHRHQRRRGRAAR